MESFNTSAKIQKRTVFFFFLFNTIFFFFAHGARAPIKKFIYKIARYLFVPH